MFPAGILITLNGLVVYWRYNLFAMRAKEEVAYSHQVGNNQTTLTFLVLLLILSIQYYDRQVTIV